MDDDPLLKYIFRKKKWEIDARGGWQECATRPWKWLIRKKIIRQWNTLTTLNRELVENADSRTMKCLRKNKGIMIIYIATSWPSFSLWKLNKLSASRQKKITKVVLWAMHGKKKIHTLFFTKQYTKICLWRYSPNKSHT